MRFIRSFVLTTAMTPDMALASLSTVIVPIQGRTHNDYLNKQNTTHRGDVAGDTFTVVLRGRALPRDIRITKCAGKVVPSPEGGSRLSVTTTLGPLGKVYLGGPVMLLLLIGFELLASFHRNIADLVRQACASMLVCAPLVTLASALTSWQIEAEALQHADFLVSTLNGTVVLPSGAEHRN